MRRTAASNGRAFPLKGLSLRGGEGEPGVLFWSSNMLQRTNGFVVVVLSLHKLLCHKVDAQLLFFSENLQRVHGVKGQR